MAQGFGIGIVIGASVAASVSSAFSTVSEKIKATRAQMLKTRNDMATMDKAIALSGKQNVLEQQLNATKDLGVSAELNKVKAEFKEASNAIRAYGSSVAEWEVGQRKAAVTLEKFTQKLHLLQAAESEQKKRAGLRQNLMEDYGLAMTVAAPVKSAISFESAMADVAKTIDGARDSSENLTEKYYEIENAVKSLGRELPLTHEQIASLFANIKNAQAPHTLQQQAIS